MKYQYNYQIKNNNKKNKQHQQMPTSYFKVKEVINQLFCC